MTVARHVTVARYRGGRTLNVPVIKDSGVLSIRESSRLLRIKSPHTINSYLKHLDLTDRDFLSWDELKEILSLREFLGLNPGQNSKAMFVLLRSRNQLATIFNENHINIEEKLERIKDDYYKQQRR
ncbi:hypothetical protein G7B40_001515 [Aetokthonos hydrillicola Thurmond2011]|jgi:hypothetical protein|uniref:Uncharacterized protein n=1 Tax=Aetokthonos hydrillicola Thurmond2011 TaxID=2712845 RepID=A0AAP5I1U6_9CYAN|nr:hypothetical protein [Aetokthonos hydrillicola]MBO3464140.1 hypothetical protein [Aetokthonos hydrillicola CCALA 1050]MBW4591074.1 hypothetical protein [Aetokthonos hydrillicola CCALA 1050]MDR9893264.1 hypothetical protein [Aetokthonos hydrillicola Thurmond2011]